MHSQYGWPIAAQLKWREKAMIAEESTSVKGCGSSLRPFHALRQPVQVTGCRGAFFYLWKGVKKYESKLHLPRLWDLFGL